MKDDLTYCHLLPESMPPEITGGPFRMVVIVSVAVSPEWQALVSDWIVRTGCLYMMAWGVDCSSWDDSVDMANLNRFDFGEIPEASSVVTTWHDDEPLEEVFWFSKNTALHPVVELSRTIILDISMEDRGHQLIEAYAAA